MSDRVVWLTDDRCRDPELAGSKAANLARLVAWGYTVPPGFCLPTDALSEDEHEKRWQDDLEAALARLTPPWAVRSSANVEDTAGRAFAGIFRTVLGVKVSADVVAAVETVRRSAHGDEAVAYSRARGVTLGEIRMAVLVQTMVDVRAGGVAFSRHPVTNEPTVLIEAIAGLGAGVVSGSVTPDRYEAGERGEIRSAGGTTLEDAEVREIAATVRSIERRFGVPQDVEWALARSGGLAILQARPAG